MKKAIVYYTEKNGRLDTKKNKSMTLEISEQMFNSWDWDGIERIFRAKVRPYIYNDSMITVNRIKLGRAILQG